MGIMKADERRLAPRHNLKIPLRVQPVGLPRAPARLAESSNVSSRGIYFSSDLPFQVGTALEVTFRMPEEVTGEVPREWVCRGRVVRTDADADSRGRTGIGVEIQSYKVSKPCDEPTAASAKQTLIDRR